jgi:ribosomal protein L16 Arg81 hydroxylase
MEGICNEGEVLHVPSGWWHLVVNLDASIAITQNFVPRSHLPSVLSFLKDKPDQVSGFKKEVNDPYATFVQCLENQHPELLAQAIMEAQQGRELRKRKWDAAIGTGAEEEFSFGFGCDSDSDKEIP